MSGTHVESTKGRPLDGQPPVRRRGAWRRRLTAIVSLTMLTTATAMAGTGSAAQAMPANCTTVNGGTYAQSLCTSGVGEHRVIMVQRHFMPGAGPIVCEGPWAPVGSVSHTNCAPHTVVSVRVETREPSGAPGMGRADAAADRAAAVGPGAGLPDRRQRDADLDRAVPYEGNMVRLHHGVLLQRRA